MFTGITQSIGKLSAIHWKNNQELRLKVETSNDFFKNVSFGDSIMLDGICLTIVDFSSSEAQFEIMVPTFTTTAVKNYKVGQNINLEKAMPASGKFDGHFVLGHVDGIGTVVRRQQVDSTILLTLQPDDQEIMKQIVKKGSITISGVSLTVITMSKKTFQIGLIPLTIQKTNLGNLNIGNEVNIETDILAKYLMKGDITHGNQR